MEPQVGGCAHGQRPSTCWHCLPITDRLESRQVWAQLQEVPGFRLTTEQAEAEAAAGKLVQLKRTDYGEKRIFIPYSALLEIVDFIMANDNREDDD